MEKINKETLVDLYINQQLSQREIAKILDLGQTTIRRYMVKYNIISRTSKEGKNTESYKKKLIELGIRYSLEYTKNTEDICAYCRNQFTKTSKQKKNKYCSKKCSNKAKEKTFFCTICGKELSFKKKKFNKKYCENCYKKVKQELAKTLSTKQIVRCALCEKEFKKIPSTVKLKNYCSVECMKQHYSILYSGANNPSWKGGKGHHYIGNFYSQRKLARKRDNYKCAICGITEKEYKKEMSVHHIKNYRFFANKEDANILNNLISVCEQCHRFIHSNKNTEKLFIKT